MKSLLALFLFLTGVLPNAWAQDKGADDAVRTTRARQATELRLAYASSPEYNPYDRTYRDHLEAASAAHKGGDLAKAIGEVQSGLKYSKYDIEMLMFLGFLYQQNQEQHKAGETNELWTSLLDSIFDSGTGRDYSTAFKVINVAEEYAVLNIMRLKPLKQSLRMHEGSSFDVFEVKDPRSEQTIEIFFNIDIPKNWLAKSLSAAPQQE